MRVRHLALACSLTFTISINAAEEEELPPLELLGFIADFSSEEEGWVDPQQLEELLTQMKQQEQPEPAAAEESREQHAEQE
ncbi:MAG: hypothetical protein OXC05_04035 [Halieaceae bacterium]|nr:hypothetical protein [Halieaceae bacterium]